MWGRSVSEIRNRLKQADYSFLKDAPVEAPELTQLLKLSRQAPYYFSFIFRELEQPELEIASLELAWEKGEGLWQERAGLSLLSALRDREAFPELERRAAEILPWLQDPQFLKRGQGLFLEALYWQGRDREVLEARRAYPAAETDLAGETLLFQAVAGCRLGEPGWPELFRKLFLLPVSSLHPRAYEFLEQEERLKRFDAAELALMEGKARFGQGRFSEAARRLEEAIGGPGPKERLLMRELGSAYYQAEEYGRGAAFLATIAEEADGPLRWEALEMAGRLYRRAGDKESAQSALERVFKGSPDRTQRDRAAFSLLDLAEKGEEFLAALERLSRLWTDPKVFADLLDRKISELMASRSWPEISRMRRILAGRASLLISSRLAYLTSRLRSEGFLPSESEGEGEGGSLTSATVDPRGYYGLLAMALTGSGDGELLPPPQGETAARNPDADPGEWERLVWGFFDYGLGRTAYEEARRFRDRLPPAFLLKVCRQLAVRGLHSEAIRLLNLYLARTNTAPGLAELAMLYPRGYSADIESLAREEGFPPFLLFALVREESLFDPLIVSRAGAVGLTQLMPETAQETARLLKMGETDLRDPATNLKLGARHFSRLLLSAGSVPRALIAYNAGLGRLRRWEGILSGLPEDLQVEAVPFQETRGYLRKILVSAAMYNALYEGRSLVESIRLFYPQLLPPFSSRG